MPTRMDHFFDKGSENCKSTYKRGPLQTRGAIFALSGFDRVGLESARPKYQQCRVSSLLLAQVLSVKASKPPQEIFMSQP